MPSKTRLIQLADEMLPFVLGFEPAEHTRAAPDRGERVRPSVTTRRCKYALRSSLSAHAKTTASELFRSPPARVVIQPAMGNSQAGYVSSGVGLARQTRASPQRPPSYLGPGCVPLLA